jgi:hypothetical protein
LAKGLRDHLPELMLLIFDKQLQAAASGEGLEAKGAS